MEKNHILNINGLKITYNPKNAPVHAVRGVDMVLDKDTDIGIMGESGCGKSSIALQILRLLDEKTAVEGLIVYNGIDLNQASEKEMNTIRWNRIAISFQNSLEVLNPVLNIQKQISEAIRWHFVLSEKQITEKVEELLGMVGLDLKWGEAFPHELSGGMRQKVLLAMALACDPEVLILDEPTTALDVKNKKEIIDLVLCLKKEKKFTLVTISHDIEVISRLSTKLYVMYSGYIVESGPTKAILEEPLHAYTRGFLNSSPLFFQYKDLWGIRSSLVNKDGPKDEGCPFAERCPQSASSCCCVPSLREVSPGRCVACHKGGIETLMQVRNVSKVYRSHAMTIQAVKHVDLEIKSGEVIALIGKSGSGKSTLAQLLVALETPESGEVMFCGEKICGTWATRMQRGVQIVMQDPISATNAHMTILDTVTEPLTVNHIGTKEDNKKNAMRLLKMVQLPCDEEFLMRRCSALSGGQRQRIAIARAIIMNPRVMIADEITSMLDPSTQANLMRELKEIQNCYGFTMLYITHDLYMARKVADRVFVMHEGEIVECGMASKIFDFPLNPVTRKLFSEFEHKNLVCD